MSDQFTKDKFQWLEQVFADHTLPPLAGKVAFWISTFINRKSGEAWPSQETLANKVGCSRKGLQIGIDALVKTGHLQAEIHKGRGKTNLYSMLLKGSENANASTHIEVDKCEPQYALTKENANTSTHLEGLKCVNSDLKMRTPVRTEPSDEPIDNRLNHLRERVSLPAILANKTQTKEDDPIASLFEDWFKQYPRKVQRAEAERAYRRTIKAKLATPDQLLNSVMRYAAERLHEPDEAARTKFTAHPATWLNQHRWLDEPEPTAVKNSNSQPSRKGNFAIAMALVGGDE